MKKSLLSKTILLPISVFVFTLQIFAACNPATDTGCLVNPLVFNSPAELISRALQLIQPIAIIGFVFSVVYAGFLKMSAGVNSDGDKKAMTIAKAAVTGFVIILLASFLTDLITNLLGVKI